MGSPLRLEATPDGWIIRVTDEAVAHLGLSDGDAVVLRAVPPPDRAIREAIAQLRGRAHEYGDDPVDGRA